LATINAVNTAWTLVAAFLVSGMQVGFVMLEFGFARERESVNILVEGIADTCICGVLSWLRRFHARLLLNYTTSGSVLATGRWPARSAVWRKELAPRRGTTPEAMG